MKLRERYIQLSDALFRFWKSPYRNYIIVTLLFLLWIFFLSPNTVQNQVRTKRELRDLRRRKQFYQKEIERNEQAIQRFKTDLDFVETYGRETYLMKKDNEDIFLFEEE
ncbi:MAG: septum formation initiator family protein [Bacteroides sp.]|nr:septum formation initiator family protein [Bacteroides sp.]MCM1086049.1 septum formation initiator family protein [Bacteroides sp.]MCM1170137.1 septum formation initiator family protein [Bacteroides sp.]